MILESTECLAHSHAKEYYPEASGVDDEKFKCNVGVSYATHSEFY